MYPLSATVMRKTTSPHNCRVHVLSRRNSFYAKLEQQRIVNSQQ